VNSNRFDRFKCRSLLCLSVLALSFVVRADDWPRWRGPLNNGQSTESLSELPSSPKVLWKTELGAGLSSPVAADGKIVIMDAANGKEVVHLINASNAEEVWMAEVDEVFSDSQGPSGPRNTPVIDGDYVYAVSCRGQFVCLSLENGFPVWDVNYVTDLGARFIGEKGNAEGASRHGNDGSPLVDGPHIIAPVGGQDAHSVVCFDKLTGTVVWHSQNDVAGYGSPVVATMAGVKQVIVFTAEATIGLRRDNGKLLWRIPMKTGFGRHVVTPVVWNDMVVVGSHELGMVGIKVSSDGDGSVKAEEIWVNKVAAPNFADPVNVGQYLFSLGPKKNVQCIDIETGKIQWDKTGLIVTSANKAYSGFIVTGENILQLTDAGELILFSANPKEFKQISRTQVSGMNWCNPALSDGVLYLRDGMKNSGDLHAIKVK
jgi:outer membrane protein assembly factor BamB